MNILILKQMVTHKEKVDFARVTLQEQLSSIISEVAELDNALLYAETHKMKESIKDVTQEALDVMQTTVQFLAILERLGADIDEELSEHNKKLIQGRDGSIDTILYINRADIRKV